MKNFNDLYLENQNSKALRAEYQLNEITDRLSGDIRKLISNEDFMKRAEYMLAEKGCFKISHSAMFVNDKIYITTSEYRPSDFVFPRFKHPDTLNANSALVQEKIGSDFINFWAERGVHVSFAYESILFVVESLWDKADEEFKEAELDEAYFNVELFSPDYKFNKASGSVDISQYVSGPFCYIK